MSRQQTRGKAGDIPFGKTPGMEGDSPLMGSAASSPNASGITETALPGGLPSAGDGYLYFLGGGLS